MADFNRHVFPAGGGWTFRQPQTGWTNPYAMVGFDASVKAIIQHRQQNKAIVAKHKLSTDYNIVANELERYTRARLGIPDPAPSFFQAGSSQLPSRVIEAAADIKRAAQGTAVIVDWFQSGGDPVDQELAERRAATCVACPKNVQGAWYTEAPAELLKSVIEAWQTIKGRKDFTFSTAQGDNLKSCAVCRCLMRVKVFTPLQHILDKTSPAIMSEFPGNCWIAKRDQ